MHSQEYASLTLEVSFSSLYFLEQQFQSRFWKEGMHHPALLKLSFKSKRNNSPPKTHTSHNVTDLFHSGRPKHAASVGKADLKWL